MLNRYPRGINFYCFYKDFSPVFALTGFRDRLDTLLELGKVIEEKKKLFSLKKKPKEARMTAYDEVINFIYCHFSFFLCRQSRLLKEI